jgi:putative ABC transport system permease protein
MALRELRRSGRHLALYGACMALGIAALVALSGLRAAITEAVSERARTLMGADLRLRARTPFSEPIVAEIERLTSGDASARATVTSFGSMALAERSGRSRLVHVQAVEPGFPFYGEIVTDPASRWDALGEGANAIVDPAVLIQLDIEVGEVLRVGQQAFTIQAAATKAPGSFGLRASVAPRVFIPAAFLDATGLVQQGSMVEYLAYLKATGDLDAWAEAKRPLLETERTTARTVSGYQEDLSESFATLTRYLGLVGLTALLLGGVGVAAGIRVFVQEKLDTAAVLRALGATSQQVTAVYLVQAGLLGMGGATLGVAMGWGVQAVLPDLLAGFLPVQLSFRPDPAVAVVGFVLGVGVSVLFAAWPLLELRRVTPLRALRRDVEPAAPHAPPAIVTAGLVAALLGAALWQAPDLTVGLFFAAGLAAALGILAGTALGLTSFLRHHVPRSAPYWLRQGVANLFRPRNQTLPATLTVGFGLFLVASVQLLQSNVLGELGADTREDRPNLVVFDVQADQQDGVLEMMEGRGTRIDDRAPMVPARITGVRGESAEQVRAESGETEAVTEQERDARWALRREYRLTYRDALRDTEEVVAGSWWTGPHSGDGPVPVSLDRELSERLGLALGDAVTWNIQGVPVESVVTNLRHIDWGRFSTNFFVVFPSGVLEDAPQSVVLLGHLADERERAELQRDLVGAFPNVSVLDASFLLRAVDAIVRQVSLAVRFMAALTLATGLVVLIAAASTSRFQRVREALLLRTLGARARTVRRILTTESFVLGALAASVGLGLATLAVWALVTFLFEHPFHVPAADLVALWVVTVGLSTALGFGHAGPALRRPPLVGLRQAEMG